MLCLSTNKSNAEHILENVITVYDLWQTIAKDCVYSQSGISLSVAGYICDKLDLLLVLAFNNTQKRTIGRGSIVQHRVLRMCEALEYAYKNHHECDPDWEASTAEIEAESFVISMLVAGLKTNSRNPPIFDPYMHDDFSLVEFAGYDEIMQQDLYEFFNEHSLPLPHALFHNSALSTDLLYKQLSASDGNWSKKLGIDDLIRFYDAHKHQGPKPIVQMQDSKFIFQCQGEYYILAYSGEVAHLKSSDGLKIFHYLIKNAYKTVALNNLLMSVYKDETFEKDAADLATDEPNISIEMSPDHSAYKKKRDRVMAACSRALTVLAKQLPPLEKHLRGATSFRGGFRYSPEKILPWKL